MKDMTEAELDARHAEKMKKKKAVRDKIVATKTIEKGLVIVHTGKGKGKSTAAFGMVFRALGHGFPVAIVQFVKGKWQTGERVALEKFGDLVSINTMGEGFTWETQDRQRDLTAARTAWERAKALVTAGQHRLVLLDELNIVLRDHYLPVEEVAAFLRDERPAHVHVIVTGRNAKDELIEIADLVTEMEMIKHPFRSGVKAQQGIEFDPALMIQGTGSHVGKSVMVAGLCRALVRRGLRVAPFKPQNMSNNAAVTADGGEIGRAQALQARACGLQPTVDMNPVLLKPEGETGAQVIVRGRRSGTMRAAEYGRRKAELLPEVLAAFERVGEGMDIVLVEGAGSPAEVNLRAGDIANMGFAEAADVPVVIVGDIDRGGVIASLVGTHAVLSETDRTRFRGFVINKFRGDAGLFSQGLALIEARTGWPSLGVVPWLPETARLPSEDSLGLAGEIARAGTLVVAVPALPRIANFDDLDPLRAESGVSVVIVRPGEAIPGDAGLVLIPGSKATIADLAFLRGQGWDIDIAAHWRRGGAVMGLCGGYQMLGRTIFDPDGMEGRKGEAVGLGLLDIGTVMGGDKITVPVAGRHAASGEALTGYEIHLGRTSGPDCARPLLDLEGRPDGAQSADGRVMGTYVHGLFASDGFRRAFLAGLGAAPSDLRYEHEVEAALDAIAAHLEQHVSIDRLLAIAGVKRTR